MNLGDKTWKVGSYGAGSRHWHVWRHGRTYCEGDQLRYEGSENAKDSRNRVRRFGSRASAQKLADELERAQAAANRWAEAMRAAEDAHAAAKKAFIEASNKASATAFNFYEEKPR